MLQSCKCLKVIIFTIWLTSKPFHILFIAVIYCYSHEFTGDGLYLLTGHTEGRFKAATNVVIILANFPSILEFAIPYPLPTLLHEWAAAKGIPENVCSLLLHDLVRRDIVLLTKHSITVITVRIWS